MVFGWNNEIGISLHQNKAEQIDKAVKHVFIHFHYKWRKNGHTCFGKFSYDILAIGIMEKRGVRNTHNFQGCQSYCVCFVGHRWNSVADNMRAESTATFHLILEIIGKYIGIIVPFLGWPFLMGQPIGEPTNRPETQLWHIWPKNIIYFIYRNIKP